MRTWRLVRKRRLPDAFTGKGAQLAGGRWNSPGIAVVYVSGSLALATLEYLVHANALRAPRNVFAVWADIPDAVAMTSIEAAKLPRHWRRYEPPVEELCAFGDAWVQKMATAILKVPSAIVPSEYNFLLNPAHPDFKRIAKGKPVSASFDARLFRSTTDTS